MEFCASDLMGAIAAVVPEREALVSARDRLSWEALDRRVTAAARAFSARGLGCHGDVARAERTASVQDHVGLLMGNCPEYLEAMMGAFRARAVPVNVNYRYTSGEVAYLLGSADLTSVVYQTRYGPALGAALEAAGAGRVRLLVHVPDDSGVPPLRGSVAFEEFLAAAPAAPAGPELPACAGDDRYILCTGGTTGFPKGVLWRQEDLYFAALGGSAKGYARPEEVVEAVAARSRTLVGLPASPFMHGAGHWSAMIIWFAGGTVVIPERPDGLDPAGLWRTVEAERVVYLAVVGDAYLRPLLDELDRGAYDVSCLKFVTTSGAITSPSTKTALLERIPGLRIIDTLGASEAGAQATETVGVRAGADARFALAESARVVRLDGDGEWGVGEEGLLAQTGRVPLGYYGDPAKTAETFPVIAGVRYAIPGDHAVRLESGEILLRGRGSQCINTGGEKVFPEEVEQVLKSHPDVADALVAGVADPRWGQTVGAVVALRPGADVGPDDLAAHVRERLAGFKAPRRWVLQAAPVGRNAIGKPDYAWAREVLASPT